MSWVGPGIFFFTNDFLTNVNMGRTVPATWTRLHDSRRYYACVYLIILRLEVGMEAGMETKLMDVDKSRPNIACTR